MLSSARWLAAAFGLLLAYAPSAYALPLVLTLDEAQSLLDQGATAPLSGSLTLDVGSLPPVATNTALNVVALTVSGGGLSIGLDDGLANPGLGVLFPDGSFLIPSLHLDVDGTDLTVTNVTGTFGPDAACGGALCLQTSFDIDPGSGGIVGVTVVAAVPEPATALLATTAGLGLALRRALRKDA